MSSRACIQQLKSGVYLTIVHYFFIFHLLHRSQFHVHQNKEKTEVYCLHPGQILQICASEFCRGFAFMFCSGGSISRNSLLSPTRSGFLFLYRRLIWFASFETFCPVTLFSGRWTPWLSEALTPPILRSPPTLPISNSSLLLLIQLSSLPLPKNYGLFFVKIAINLEFRLSISIYFTLKPNCSNLCLYPPIVDKCILCRSGVSILE